jgi:DegV family protein with EDD domain
MLKIVTDGAADMPDSWEKMFGIQILPLRIRFGEEELLQGRDVTSKNFYRLVTEKKDFPKTSLPAPEEIKEFYRKIANNDDAILSIHVASKMSGTFSAVQTAAKELVGELDVFPFDSGAGSAAIGYMCREARRLADLGFSTTKILECLSDLRSKISVIFTLENLEFARMSGRISSLQSTISSILKINPIIYLKDGLLHVGQKVRTRQTALETIIDEIKNRLSGQEANIAIVHANTPETARLLTEKVKAIIPAVKEIIVTELAIPVAAHLGPGAIGIVAYPAGEGCR